MDMIMERIRLKANAHQNPLTTKPATKYSAIKMITALMTRRNKPRVRMVTGMVNRISKGLINALSMARTIDTISASQKLATATPGRI